MQKFKRENLLANYKLGRDVYLKRVRQAEVQTELTDVTNQAASENNGSVVHTVLDGLGLTESAQRRSDLQQQNDSLNGDIVQIQSQAPADEASISPYTGHDIRNAIGAYAGSFIGFGSGHAIQDRYFTKGLIFTATEAGAIAGIVLGSKNSNALAFSSVCALIGLKIWETIDLFSYAWHAHEGYPHLYGATLLVSPASAQITFNW